MDIYIKPVKKTSLNARRTILIEDVAEVIATDKVAAKVKKMKLMNIYADGEHKKNYLVSVTDIIKTIKKTYPDMSVVNVGEMDTLVQHMKEEIRDRPWLKWLKVACVVLILIAGSATAVMSFHTDSQIPKVFENFYRIFYGHENSNPLIVSIPYSIGLAIGIILFYNHFMGKKITDDPTPIEVEMEKYEDDVTKTVVEMLSDREKDADSSAAL